MLFPGMDKPILFSTQVLFSLEVLKKEQEV